MSFFSSGNIPAITSFANAEKYYNKKKFPRSKYWPDANKRPLRRTSDPQFALTQHLNIPDPDRKGQENELQTVYSVDLYEHPVITYFPPHPDGSYRVIINMSRSFWSRKMTREWVDLHFNDRFRDKAMEVRFVPLGPPASHISASLWFEAEGEGEEAQELVKKYPTSARLNPEKSWHVPMYKKVATKEDRGVSIALRKAIRPYLDLALLYAEEVVREVEKARQDDEEMGVWKVLRNGGYTQMKDITTKAKQTYFDLFFRDPTHSPTAAQLALLRSAYVGITLALFIEDEREQGVRRWKNRQGSTLPPSVPLPPLPEYLHNNQTRIEATLIRYLQSPFRKQSGEIALPQFPLMSTIKGRGYFFKPI